MIWSSGVYDQSCRKTPWKPRTNNHLEGTDEIELFPILLTFTVGNFTKVLAHLINFRAYPTDPFLWTYVWPINNGRSRISRVRELKIDRSLHIWRFYVRVSEFYHMTYTVANMRYFQLFPPAPMHHRVSLKLWSHDIPSSFTHAW